MQRLKRVFAIDIETCPDCGGTLRVIACSCLAGEDSDGSGDARVASAVRNKPPILVGMPEKVVNNSLYLTSHSI
jgi:hypothetical protein